MDEQDGGGAWTGAVRAPQVERVLEGARWLTGVHPVGTVGSTQDLALALAADGCATGTIVVADHQQAGRGRRGRRWDDQPDGGTLAMTVLLDVAAVASGGAMVQLLPHAVGLAVVMGCAEIAPGATSLRLKWPNDVVHRQGPSGGPRKLSGVLVERERIVGPAARDVLLCGIGVDVDLRATGAGPDRVSLAELAGGEVDRPALLAALIGRLDDALELLDRAPDRLLDQYRLLSDTIGRRITVDSVGETIIGTATAIDGTGRLLVTTGAGVRAILSGTLRDADGDGGLA